MRPNEHDRKHRIGVTLMRPGARGGDSAKIFECTLINSLGGSRSLG